MVELHDPLTLACVPVLPDRPMKAAMSEAFVARSHAPDGRNDRLHRRWSEGGYGLLNSRTVMVDGTQLGEPTRHAVDNDPLVKDLFSVLSRPLLARLQSTAAATALADGITRRAPRVTAPAREVWLRAPQARRARKWIRN